LIAELIKIRKSGVGKTLNQIKDLVIRPSVYVNYNETMHPGVSEMVGNIGNSQLAMSLSLIQELVVLLHTT